MTNYRVHDVARHFHAAEQAASEHVERLAREILRKNPTLTEFSMGMGVYGFHTQDGRYIDPQESYINPVVPKRQFRALNSFIDKWNRDLRITGERMRFTADGPKITNS